jgi:hypothetical protein
LRPDGGRQKTEDRRQKAEDRRQKTEGRRQESEDRESGYQNIRVQSTGRLTAGIRESGD